MIHNAEHGLYNSLSVLLVRDNGDMSGAWYGLVCCVGRLRHDGMKLSSQHLPLLRVEDAVWFGCIQNNHRKLSPTFTL
jgi:hypothetical protein